MSHTFCIIYLGELSPVIGSKQEKSIYFNEIEIAPKSVSDFIS